MYEYAIKIRWLKALSDQGCVTTEYSRRPSKLQNAEVRAVGFPRAQDLLQGISVATPCTPGFEHVQSMRRDSAFCNARNIKTPR